MAGGVNEINEKPVAVLLLSNVGQVLFCQLVVQGDGPGKRREGEMTTKGTINDLR